MRDGVDVPGDSLRLIVLDRVPWATPTILERARREAFGGNAWQDMIVRLRLRQAFGRLIRKRDDRGVFVVLDPRLASRFCTAFPPGMPLSTPRPCRCDRAGEGFCGRTLDLNVVGCSILILTLEVLMGHMDKRSVTLSEELAQTIDEVVAAGEYASSSDVISDALRQWKERRDLFGYSVEELRRLIQEGIDSGPGRFVSMDEIIAEAHRRAERTKQAS